MDFDHAGPVMQAIWTAAFATLRKVPVYMETTTPDNVDFCSFARWKLWAYTNGRCPHAYTETIQTWILVKNFTSQKRHCWLTAKVIGLVGTC